MTLKITFGIFHLKIKLFYDGGDDRDGLFKMIYNTINNSFYIPKNNLAQTHSLIYKREMTLTLVYNYKVNNVGLRENDRRVLKRIT